MNASDRYGLPLREFPAGVTGEGMMLKGPYHSAHWHARSKDGVDRLSVLPDELLKIIFEATHELWSDGIPGKALNFSRRLLPFSRQLQYQAPTIRTWPRFRHFARTVTASADLAALVRALELACTDKAEEPPFASAGERVAFWKQLGSLQVLNITVLSDVLPTMDELDGFEQDELLTKVTSARVAGDWVDWAEPSPVNSYKNLLRLAPNLESLAMWVDDKVPAANGSEAGDGAVAEYLSLTAVDIRGHLTQVKGHVAGLLKSLPNLTKLELKELSPGQSPNSLVDALDLPKLETLLLTATGATDEPQHNGQVFYFGWQPEEEPPPPVTTSLAKFAHLKKLQLDCTSSPTFLLSLPNTLEHFRATEHSAVALPILTRLLTLGSADHLPNLKAFHSEFQPDELRGECMWGLQLGRAKIPYLPVHENGDPDFSLQEFWDFAPKFPQEGEWTYDAFERLARLAEAGGVDLGDTPLMFPHCCETRRRDELVVRAELKRRWEAGELVWRKDIKGVARTLGYQKQSGETPEPEPFGHKKRAPGTRPDGVKPTKNRKRHRRGKR